MSTTYSDPQPPGPMGWGLQDQPINGRYIAEQKSFDRLVAEMPQCCYEKPAKDYMQSPIYQKAIELQKADGIEDGFDFSYLEKALFGNRLTWLAQTIGSCFKAGTLIRMGDGSHKQIQDLKLFDEVLTAEGNVHRVTHLFGREAAEPIYSLTLWGHHRVQMTGEHPVLTQRGYIKACELAINDYVAVPKYAPMGSKIVQTAAHVRMNEQSRRKYAKHVGASHTGQHYVQGGMVKVYGKVPDFIELDKDFGYICGLYLAEGSTDGNKVIWSFSANEKDTLVARLVDLLKSKFDIEASVVLTARGGKTVGLRGIATGCKVSVHSIAWSSFFPSFLGSLSSGKRLHSDASSGCKEFLQGLWDGWIDGDGYERGNKTQGTTVSKQLALDMHSIANALGYCPNINACDPMGSHGIKVRQRRYDVSVVDGNKLCCHETDTHVWRKVKGIDSQEYTGKVYNFEVECDNSYVADGIGVHNCVASGWMRAHFARCMAEITLIGQPEEFFGTDKPDQNSANSLCAFAPYNYGMGREIGGIDSGGDGSFCGAHVQSAMQFGSIPCWTQGLTQYSSQFPEPIQSQATYQKWGDRQYRSVRAKFHAIAADFKQTETIKVTTVDQSRDQITKHLKPQMICSGWGFAPASKIPGTEFWVYKRSGSWAHNMTRYGYVMIKGNWYAVIKNSWGMNAHKNGDYFLVEASEDARWLREAECQTIGELILPESRPVV
jgi:hypothetical protein